MNLEYQRVVAGEITVDEAIDLIDQKGTEFLESAN